MINITLALANPFSKRDFRMIKSKGFKTPFKNKFIELQLSRDVSIIGVCMQVRSRCDHAGLMLEFALLGYCFEFNFYDSRHWDYQENRYKNDRI